MNNFIKAITNSRLYTAIVVVIIAVIMYILISKIIDKILEKDKKYQRLGRKRKTAFKMFHNVIKYIIILITIFLILQVYGVNVTSLVAGLGIISVIAGLAIQDPLKDIISGMNIVSDDYFALGDVIKIDDIEGKVIELGARTTKVKDIKNGDILVIANRNISKTLKLSNELYLDIPLSYDDEISKVEEVLKMAASIIEKLDNVTEANYIGLNEFADSSMIYKMKILCNPEFRLPIKRAANRIIKSELDKKGISIPFPQLTIHDGN